MNEVYKLKTAFIIVSWNVKEYVSQCIESIQKYTHGNDYEIIMIDNASNDGTIEFIQHRYPEVKTIANDKNVGFAAANNIAVKTTDADILAFTNPDTELTSKIDPLLEHLQNENIAAVFGRLKYPGGSTQNFIRNFPTLLNAVGEIFALPNLFPNLACLSELVRNSNHSIYDKPHFIEAGSGAFFVIRKDIFIECGFFDEHYFVYGEETDLFFQLKKMGYKVFYDPDVTIIHHHGKSTSQNPKMYVMLQKNKHFFIQKNHSHIHATIYRYIILVAFDVLRYVWAAIKALLVPGNMDDQSKEKAHKHKLAILWEIFNK